MTTKYFEFVLKYTTTITIGINLRYAIDSVVLCHVILVTVPVTH